MDFFDIHQERRINENLRDAQQANNKAAAAHRELERIDAKMERIHLAAAAVWELLRDRMGLTDEDLLEKIREIDLRDGVLDGRIRRGPQTCPECARPNNGRRPRCLYCGQDLPPPPPIG